MGSTYDPMLSKVIVHGPDRATALRMLRGALADTVILGVQTNAGFLRRLLAHPDVVSGDLDTGLVERDLSGLLPEGVPPEVYAAAALLAGTAPEPRAAKWADPFDAASGWRLGGTPAWTVHHFRLPGLDPVEVRTRQVGAEQDILLDAVDSGAPARGRTVGRTPDTVTVELDGVTHRFSHTASPEGSGSAATPTPGTCRRTTPSPRTWAAADAGARTPWPPRCPAPSPWSRWPSATGWRPGRACWSSRR